MPNRQFQFCEPSNIRLDLPHGMPGESDEAASRVLDLLDERDEWLGDDMHPSPDEQTRPLRSHLIVFTPSEQAAESSETAYYLRPAYARCISSCSIRFIHRGRLNAQHVKLIVSPSGRAQQFVVDAEVSVIGDVDDGFVEYLAVFTRQNEAVLV